MSNQLLAQALGGRTSASCVLPSRREHRKAPRASPFPHHSRCALQRVRFGAEELIQIAEEAIETPRKPLPPVVENIVKDPEVVEMVSDYNKNTINYTVEKGLVDLDTIIETPENELVDKEEKLKDLKEVSAKLLTTEKGMEVVKEIAVEVERLEKEVGKPKTTKKRRRRR